MNRDVDSLPDDDRVRSALRELARHARHEPSRPLHGDVVSGSSVAGHPWRRSAVAVAAVASVVIAGALLVRRTPGDVIVDEPPTTTTSAEPATGWFTELAPDSAAVLPDAPIAGRIGPATVWTGSEMLVWGGADLVDNAEVPLADGAAFDPVTSVWRVIPVAPIEGRAYAATVWTGTEMIVWGGSRTGVVVGDGAAFDPTTNEWRTLPDSPVGPAMKSAAAWTGTEMILIGGDASGSASAAYDPTTDRWRELPDAPGAVTPPYPQAVWTGAAVLTTIQDPEASLMQSFKLAMYRPDVNEWEVVQEQFPSQFLVGVPGVDLGMVGDEAVALTFTSGVSMPVLSPFGDIGLDLGPKPSDLAGVGAWQPIWSGREILLWAGGDKGLALDPLTDEWREFPAGDVAKRTDGAIVWADGVLLAWGGFVSNSDGTASAAHDGIIYRPAAPPNSTETPSSPTPSIDTTEGCPEDHAGDWTPGPDGITDYVDFVRLNGRMYDQAISTALAPAELGDIVGQVCFTLGDMTFDGSAPGQDGDASFLAVGTELRAIPGANPDLRIATVTDSSVTVYEVTYVEDAEVGADLIDLGAEVTEIWVNSDVDGRRIAPITDRDTVDTLIGQLASAPVDLSTRPGSERAGLRYFIELVRADGTTTTRAYWIDTGELWPGIDLPSTWRTAVEDALSTAGSVAPQLDPEGGIDGPVMYWRQRDSEGGDDALILGVLTLEGDCLYVTSESGRFPILWPYGTSWNADATAVELPDGERIPLGGTVEYGGGYRDAAALDTFTTSPDVAELAQRCADGEHDEVAVVL